MNNTMTVRPVWMLMAVLSFVVVMFVGAGAQASVIDSTPFVDKITSSKNEFHPREIAEIGMEFSEKPGQKFKPGDEMILPLPAEFKGFPSTMMLEDYAQVFVEQGQVRIVFTDKVTKKNHVKGMVKFSIKAADNVERGTTKDVSLDLGTKANPFPIVKVSGYPAVTEGEGDRPRQPSPFGYKGGSVNDNDSELIDWYVVVNADRLQVSSNTVLRDTLGKGHEYVPGSFTINYRPMTPADGQVVINGNSFELTLNQSALNGTSMQVGYQTRITESGKKMKSFKNDFKLDFQLPNQSPNSVSGDAQVQSVLMTGVIEGDEEDIHEGKEESVEGMTEETLTELEQLEDIDNHATNCVEDEHACEHVEIKFNEIHVRMAEELQVEETLGDFEEIVEEHGEVEVEDEDVTETAEVTEADVRASVVEEEVEEEITEIAPEKVEKEVVVPEADQKVEDTKTEEVVTPEIEDAKTEEEVVAPEVEEEKKNEEVVAPEKKNQEVKSVEVKENKSEEKVAAKQANKTVAPAEKKTVSTVKAAELPQTGSSDNKLFAVLGVALMMFAGWLIRRRSGK